mmetsp:Transcript_22511/g.57381  ORF Transcript_22511/g.57381 Transcript_22511/m.57381 type:complete len:242 (-) Transcript_22511:543-1268(-)
MSSKPRARIARVNSRLSTVPDLSSSHFRKRSQTLSDERASASRSENDTYSAKFTFPLPSVSSASKRFLRSTSVNSPCSRSRTNWQNSAKSSILSPSVSAALRPSAFWRIPSANSSSPVPMTSSSPPRSFFAFLFGSGFPCFECALNAFLSSGYSICPSPLSSRILKTLSTSFFGASNPRTATAWRNSFLSMAPLPSASQSLKRSISLIECSARACVSCSAMVSPLLASSLTIGGNAATRLP